MFKFSTNLIENFLEKVGIDSLSPETLNDPRLWWVLGLGIAGSLSTTLLKLARQWIQLMRQRRLKRDLHPYFSFNDIKKATQHYVPTYFQSNTPSEHSELIQAFKLTARQQLMPFFLKKAFKRDMDEHRFYIILAGSGMGKTTFMINLYMYYLQRLSFNRQMYHIKLLPLGYPEILQRIAAIPEKEHTILLLDGLDEDPQAIRNYKKRMNRILDKVRDFRVVVFTCRTQFFPSEMEEPHETGVVKFGTKQGFQVFTKMYLSPFDEKDIRLFLRKKYGRWPTAKKRKAAAIVGQSPSLMVRPMILSYIDDLLEGHERFAYSSQLYQALIGRWIEREAQRVKPDRRENFRAELHRFSREVALDIYRSRKQRKGLFIPQKDIRPLAEKHGIQLKEMEMKSRSLLNRNAMGQYKFAHKSILEYFLAVEAIEDTHFAQNFSFEGMDQARLFYDELCLSRHTLPCLRQYAGKGSYQLNNGRPKDLGAVKEQELKHIEELYVKGIDEIGPLRPLKYLRKLHIDGSPVQSLQPLENLLELEELHACHSGISDLQALSKMEQLRCLKLDHCPITDISPLQQAEMLETLSLAHTAVENLRPLYHLIHLHHLNLQHTAVKELNALKNLGQLRFLSLHHTPVNALNPLRRMQLLEQLYLGNTQIQSISPLQNLSKLKILSIPDTQVQSVRSLAALTSLQRLNLSNCPVTDLQGLDQLQELRQLNLRKVQVKDFKELSSMQQLESLVLDFTAFRQVELLSGLTQLRELSLRGTAIRSTRPLLALTQLQKVEFSPKQLPEAELQALGTALPACSVEVR